jgi:AcrR family transcriptional regulator
VARQVRDPLAKRRIVDAAWEMVATAGLGGATVRAIAAHAGVSTGFVMHYFPDKTQLAAAVLDLNNQRAARRVESARRRNRGLAGLVAAVEALLPLDAARRLEWQVWVAFWSDGGGERAAPLAAASIGLAGLLTASLAEAIDDGELPDGIDLAYEAERLITLAAGLGLMAGLDSGRRVRRLARRMLDDHLAALGRVPART